MRFYAAPAELLPPQPAAESRTLGMDAVPLVGPGTSGGCRDRVSEDPCLSMRQRLDGQSMQLHLQFLFREILAFTSKYHQSLLLLIVLTWSFGKYYTVTKLSLSRGREFISIPFSIFLHLPDQTLPKYIHTLRTLVIVSVNFSITQKTDTAIPTACPNVA